MQRNVSGIERVASIAAGAALLAWAARRGTPRRLPTTITALGLLGRGAAGYCPINAATGRGRRRDHARRALAGSRGIRVVESTTIDAPAWTLYDFWRQLENLPQIVPQIDRVDVVDDTRSHWTMRGPAGVTLEWDARIINDIPGEKIAWESLPGSDIASAGSITFTPVGRGRTKVGVLLQYDPPGGKLGAALASIMGRAPAADVREGLRRVKQLIELGSAPGPVAAVER